MPNKDLIKKSILPFIIMCCAISSRSAFCQEAAAADLNSRSPCVGWESEPDHLIVRHLCVVEATPGDQRPKYVQNWGTTTYKFLFSPGGLALVVEAQELEDLRFDPVRRDELIANLSEDRITVWHNDALYWWNWLESANKKWERLRDLPTEQG